MRPGYLIKKSRPLPRFARPCGIFRLKYPVKIRSTIRELCLDSLGHVVYFGLNLRSGSDQKFESFASLRSTNVVYFSLNLRSKSYKNSIAWPRFARPYVVFWLQSPFKIRSKILELCSLRPVMCLISAQIPGQNQIKKSRMHRFARPCGLFLCWLKSFCKITSTNRELCLASLDQVVYIGFNLQSKSVQKFESFASLRSTMWYISA